MFHASQPHLHTYAQRRSDFFELASSLAEVNRLASGVEAEAALMPAGSEPAKAARSQLGQLRSQAAVLRLQTRNAFDYAGRARRRARGDVGPEAKLVLDQDAELDRADLDEVLAGATSVELGADDAFDDVVFTIGQERLMPDWWYEVPSNRMMIEAGYDPLEFAPEARMQQQLNMLESLGVRVSGFGAAGMSPSELNLRAIGLRRTIADNARSVRHSKRRLERAVKRLAGKRATLKGLPRLSDGKSEKFADPTRAQLLRVQIRSLARTVASGETRIARLEAQQAQLAVKLEEVRAQRAAALADKHAQEAGDKVASGQQYAALGDQAGASKAYEEARQLHEAAAAEQVQVEKHTEKAEVLTAVAQAADEGAQAASDLAKVAEAKATHEADLAVASGTSGSMAKKAEADALEQERVAGQAATALAMRVAKLEEMVAVLTAAAESPAIVHPDQGVGMAAEGQPEAELVDVVEDVEYVPGGAFREGTDAWNQQQSNLDAQLASLEAQGVWISGTQFGAAPAAGGGGNNVMDFIGNLLGKGMDLAGNIAGAVAAGQSGNRQTTTQNIADQLRGSGYQSQANQDLVAAQQQALQQTEMQLAMARAREEERMRQEALAAQKGSFPWGWVLGGIGLVATLGIGAMFAFGGRGNVLPSRNKRGEFLPFDDAAPSLRDYQPGSPSFALSRDRGGRYVSPRFEAPGVGEGNVLPSRNSHGMFLPFSQAAPSLEDYEPGSPSFALSRDRNGRYVSTEVGAPGVGEGNVVEGTGLWDGSQLTNVQINEPVGAMWTA